jgi:hypothetical protein
VLALLHGTARGGVPTEVSRESATIPACNDRALGETRLDPTAPASHQPLKE